MKYCFDDLEMLKVGEEWDKRTPKERLQYALGGLLYTPASYENVLESLIMQKYPELKTWVFCLEDSIQDAGLAGAEKQLLLSLDEIAQAIMRNKLKQEDLPLLFIRVRNPEQMAELYEKIRPYTYLLSGFVAPKFDPSVMTRYIHLMNDINNKQPTILYLMPILESGAIINLKNRLENLLALFEGLEKIKPWVLNIRVGGNDFSNQFGLRRGPNQTVYDMGLINSVLMDILNIFGRDYVVSAPVWEYFGSEKDLSWQEGLQRETRLDRLNGFIGKTAIHPSQLGIINRSLVVDEVDYQDALQICQWSDDESLGVKKGGIGTSRMNEARVHSRWAQKILALSTIYGVRKE